MLSRRNIALLSGVGAAALASQAKADTLFTAFAFPATGRSVSATDPDRWSDILNVKHDFGAKGDGTTNDTSAVQAAFTAMSSTPGTIFFPPGRYLVTSPIDISNASGNDAGAVIGAGRGAVEIFGTINNNFIFTRRNSVGGPALICDLAITNSSSVIGTGALRFLNSSGGAELSRLALTGQIALDIGWNSFNVNILSCNFSPVTPDEPGTTGIISNGCNLIGCRSSSWDIWFAGFGSNGHNLFGNSFESGNIGYFLGLYQGWASACTVSGTTLTVGGELSPLATFSSNSENFHANDFLYGPGITYNGWPTLPFSAGTTIVSQLTNTNVNGFPGQEGTYQLSQSYSISSPVPMFTRRGFALHGCSVQGLETEGCMNAVVANSVGGCVLDAMDLTGAMGEVPLQGGGKALTGFSALYIVGCSNTRISGFNGGVTTIGGQIYFDPFASTSGLVFDGCLADATANGVTDSTTTIVGTLMTINGMVSGQFGYGMTLTGAGVTSSTVIVNQLTNTSGGPGGLQGTYTVSPSQTVAATTITGLGGPSIVYPTGGALRAGIASLGNNKGVPTLIIVFNELPGQSGSDANNIDVSEGLQYSISDGAKSGGGTAAMGDTVQGGGSQHIAVRYTGSVWTRCG